MGNNIQEILEQGRRRAMATTAPEAEPVIEEKQEDQFFSLLVTAGLEENFIEFRMRDSLCLCLPYNQLIWFDHHPDEGINLEFGSCLITIKGRGLKNRLFEGIKKKRVAWVKEADLEMQDHADNSVFVEEIQITPPETAEESG